MCMLPKLLKQSTTILELSIWKLNLGDVLMWNQDCISESNVDGKCK